MSHEIRPGLWLTFRSERDLRSHAMRSKLLSLHLVLTILKSHADLFSNSLVCIPSAPSTRCLS
jgi:brefeldin A-inhibited guanine nucleotide-exchange protein